MLLLIDILNAPGIDNSSIDEEVEKRQPVTVAFQMGLIGRPILICSRVKS
jgi:hypothetical protein